jgi:hypothetical protein
MLSQDEQSNIKLFQCTGTVKQNFLLRCRVAYEKNAQKLVVEDGIIIAYRLPNSMSNKPALQQQRSGRGGNANRMRR